MKVIRGVISEAEWRGRTALENSAFGR